jgi:hypothetical protein
MRRGCAGRVLCWRWWWERLSSILGLRSNPDVPNGVRVRGAPPHLEAILGVSIGSRFLRVTTQDAAEERGRAVYALFTP